MDFALDQIDTKDAANDGVFFNLLRVDGIPLRNANDEPIRLKVVGTDSDLYQRAFRARTRKQLRRVEEGKLTEDELADAAKEDNLDLIAECTVGWEGVLTSKGEPISFSREAALELYRKYPIARDQADQAIARRALFIKASKGD